MTGARSLAGVVVLDLSRLLPGPLCTWYLQGLGARVIRVEDPRPGGGDWSRHMPPYTPEGVGAWFAALNAGKESIALDLSADAEREALLGLLAHADVLVEGYRPGVMARLGLAPDRLVERFPRLIVASLSGFGQDGPLRDRPGHDLGYAGLTGALALGARHDGVPDPPELQLADVAGGALTGALSIAAALVARARTGRGRWLDVSLTDGLLALVGPHLAATACGSPPVPGGEALTGGLPFYRMYRCADGGIVAVAALEPKFQEALRAGLRDALGREVELTVEDLAAAFATRPRDQWATALADACVTPVLEPAEVLEHPLHRARGSIVGEGAGRRVRPPFPGAGREAAMPPPTAGQDTERILAEFGVTPAEQP
ncbi:MAG: CoA transferase [Deltaproteobacteria bacterium]|nr:MAG: CoA transferase [Deltaproteobacteria bacterium]